ncbi:galactose-3-O-sulfotransferase 4-like isoform X2 [Orbicella faveolata]|uniref:galactose-3-O-sulfotransferase 4-like isoform X2 n=1 Tax=Orbicella faveolata TaxID=48498 RepID=UPI0009E41AA2|nr:galactose-3-O-sulfotransferase 4-like isoform X2 [Orbicella faveolata]
MKFKSFLLLCFLGLSLMSFIATLLLPRIKEKNLLRFPFDTLLRNTHDSSSDDSSQPSSGASWLEKTGSRNVSAVDREFWDLLQNAKRQSEDESNDNDDVDDDEIELEEEDGKQESSTKTSHVQYDELSCKPHQEIAFLKTHKTGSSTLTNILNRYADLRELKMALPAQHLYRFGWPGYFHWHAVDLWRLNGEPAHVLCNHARYNRPAMEVIMQSDTKYITILRDPVYQFESTFNYMELYRFFKLTNYSNPLQVFLRNPHGYLKNLTRTVKSFPESMHLVRNGMFFDLGLPPSAQDNDKEIRTAIKKVESEFSLVLIMEYFDESLVLLKREFCWDIDDVIYIKQNQRKAGNNTSNRALSTQLKYMIRDWNRADVLLYEHFNKTFWERIKRHGEGFYKDLADLKRKNVEMFNDCVSPEEVTEIAFRLSGQIRGFKLNERVSRYNRYLCEKLLTNEIDYIHYFRRKLHPYYGYQKQLRASGKTRQAGENVIVKRISAMKSVKPL